MYKYLEKQNKRAQAYALTADNPQPFYKHYIETNKACPYCSALLSSVYDKEVSWNYTCDCGRWTYDWSAPKFSYEPKPKPIN